MTRSPVTSPLDTLIRTQKRQRASALRLAAFSAVTVGAASTLLLGLSGWFIVASAIARVPDRIVSAPSCGLIRCSLIGSL